MGVIYNKAFSAIVIVVVLPLVLIHGYSDDVSVWDTWEGWLEQEDNITKVTSINFKDKCGTVVQHAAELGKILDKIDGPINIVAHSKGGLDARLYVSQHPDKVVNLVMIGTPNEGTPAAYMDVTSCAGSTGLSDLWPASEATKTPDQISTRYYAIAGNYSTPCSILMVWWECHTTENDGFVPVDSAISGYSSLGIYPVNHSSLLTARDIYEKVIPIINGSH